MENFLIAQDGIDNVHSVVELIEEMNWVITDNREIPETSAEVGNLWFLLEGEESLSQMVNRNATEGLIMGNVVSINSAIIERIVKAVDQYISENSGHGIEFIQNGILHFTTG